MSWDDTSPDYHDSCRNKQEGREIMSEDAHDSYRTRREYFHEMEYKFALCLKLNGEVYLMPLTCIIISTDEQAWKATRKEAVGILCNEELWSEGCPVWAANFIPELSYEDAVLFKEMQRFPN